MADNHAPIPHKFLPVDFEPRWQSFWEAFSIYKTPDVSSLKKFRGKKYILDMFPYPSAQGLHVGHPEGYTATDIYARYLRMKGFAVMHPMGWDAFGLPAENYAIKVGEPPEKTTNKAISNFTRQIKSLGFSYDWGRELATCRPEYYRWTQWLFSFLYQQKLAYKAKAPVNWCEHCQTVLANEQAEGGICERCKNTVIQKEIEQWFFKITAFTEELLADLETIDWPKSTKLGQTNWIGKSEGLLIKFEVIGTDKEKPIEIEVFTTRPDTIFGVTYLVLAPEHPQVPNITKLDLTTKVKEYQRKTATKNQLERINLDKGKTGLDTGAKAINPLTGQEIPIYIADYVVMGYGTGAVMGVPAHDERDFAFAKKHNLPIIPVCLPEKIYQKLNLSDKNLPQKTAGNSINKNKQKMREIIPAKVVDGFPQTGEISREIEAILPYVEEGIVVNSGDFSGQTSERCYQNISEKLLALEKGKKSVKYKLRDWLISRQRYWGAPIPIIYCNKCGEVLVPAKDLPVLLPEDVDFRPTGESPLARSASFHQVSCPKCGLPARRESDTMDTFVCSSWYFFAFAFWEKINQEKTTGKIGTQAQNSSKIDNIYERFAQEIAAWLPVDLYVGGAEHTVLHLLYSRFITKALNQAGLVTINEPFSKLRHIGMILGLDGQKMSKSRGNVINPDDMVKRFGGDTVRLYEMFMGPLSEKKAWNMHGVEGVHRFLSRVWHLYQPFAKAKKEQDDNELSLKTQKLLQDVEADINNLKFNTAIAKMMEWLNFVTAKKFAFQTAFKTFLLVLAPFAPHLAEELWWILAGRPDLKIYQSIHSLAWPKIQDKEVLVRTNTLILVEVNGKLVEKMKGEFKTQKEAENMALSLPRVQSRIANHPILKTVYIPQKLVNFVV